MKVCYECDVEDNDGDYITEGGLCLDCAAFMNAYDCAPDCRTRAKCWEEGPTHTMCGTCFTCFKPNHHHHATPCKESD